MVKAQDIQHEGALQMQHNNRQEKGWGNKQTNKPLKKKNQKHRADNKHFNKQYMLFIRVRVRRPKHKTDHPLYLCVYK